MSNSELIQPAGSPRRRMLALTAAGCFLNWIPGRRDDGTGTNDSAYIWFVRGDQICEAWGFSFEDANRAWADFLLRNRTEYPNGNWRQNEREFLDSLEDAEVSHGAKNL